MIFPFAPVNRFGDWGVVRPCAYISAFNELMQASMCYFFMKMHLIPSCDIQNNLTQNTAKTLISS